MWSSPSKRFLQEKAVVGDLWILGLFDIRFLTESYGLIVGAFGKSGIFGAHGGEGVVLPFDRNFVGSPRVDRDSLNDYQRNCFYFIPMGFGDFM